MQDQIGKKYGMLTAITRVDNRGRGHYWLFECECGVRKECAIGSVKAGKIVSCGCKYRKNWESFIGKAFGELTVIGIGKVIKYKQYLICKNKDGIIKELSYIAISKDDTVSGYKKADGINPNWKGHGEIGSRWFSKIIRGAKIRKLEINITIKDVYEKYIEQDKLCALSGIPIKFGDSRYSEDTASLDRKDNTLGYTKENIQLVHKSINMFKNRYNDNEFISICRMVAKHTQHIEINENGNMPLYWKRIIR